MYYKISLLLKHIVKKTLKKITNYKAADSIIPELQKRKKELHWVYCGCFSVKSLKKKEIILVFTGFLSIGKRERCGERFEDKEISQKTVQLYYLQIHLIHVVS